jgi:hypothetical protein
VQLPGAEPLRAQELQRFRDAAAPLIAALLPPQQAVPPASVAGTVPGAPAPSPGNASPPAAAAPSTAGSVPEPRSKASIN